MTQLNIPDKKDFGFGDVVELSYLQQIFGITRRIASKYLKALRINPLYIGDKTYFSLPTFKRILFVLSQPGAKGFIFPGSKAKRNPRFINNDEYMTEVDDEILRKAADPKILAEMIAAEGRDNSILKKFITQPEGRPKQEDKKNNDCG